ncbi:hypothetical protein OT109_07830 [Phycisphaeraceae bacterium D3-23]
MMTQRRRSTRLLGLMLTAALTLLAWPEPARGDVRTPSPEADARLIFVAPDGDNTNPGTAADAPVASIQIGLDRLRDNNADWLLLKRGHTYSVESLASLPDGASANRPAVIAAFGQGATPNLVVRGNAANTFSQASRRDQHVHLYHVNLIRQDNLSAPRTNLWPGVSPIAVTTLDHVADTGLEAVLKNPVGMTSVSIEASGNFYRNENLAFLVHTRTRLSALASDDGVTIRGFGIKIHNTDDAGVEHLRVRLGDDNVQDAVNSQGQVIREGRGDKSQLGNGADCVQVFNATDTQLTHLSLFWALDESLDIAASPGTEVYRCLLAECLNEAYHTGSDGARIYDHSKALLVAGWDVPNGFFANNYPPVVVRECLFAHNGDRNPGWTDSLPALTNGGKTLLNFAFVNNVVYNPVRILGHPNPFTGNDPTVNIDFIGNVFILGPDSPDDYRPQYWVNLLNTVNNPDGSVYVANNWVIDKNGVAHDLLDWMDARDLNWAEQPHFDYDTPLETDRDALIDTVLTYAGDYTHRDEHDWRVVNDVRNNTGNIIDSQREVID